MPAGTATEPTLLELLEQRQTELTDAWAEYINTHEEARKAFDERMNSDEFRALAQEARDAEINTFRDRNTTFRSESDRMKAEINDVKQRIADQQQISEHRTAAAAASSDSPSVRIINEAHVYRADNARGMDGQSWYRDLAMVEADVTFDTGGTKDQARGRLERHAKVIETEMPVRMQQRERDAQRQVAEAEERFLASFSGKRNANVDRVLREIRDNGLQFNPFERRVEPNSAQGYGGYFVPPFWIVDQFIPGLRPHMVVAAFPRQMDLPAGTNSINIPKLAQLTEVGYQQQNNSGLPSRDWKDTFVQANVKTIGGYSDVALQLLEQSPINVVDEVITQDLMADFFRFLNSQIIAGDGIGTTELNGGHLMGIYNGAGGGNWTGTNTVTYTDGSPEPAHMAPGVFAPMWSKIASNRYAPGSDFKIAVHGSRWAYYSSGLDVNGHPLGETLAGGRFNIQAAIDAGLPAEGLVGTLPYLSDAPVYADDTIPVTDATGGGTNQDVAIAGKWDDAWLFQGDMRTEVFREVLSGSMGVRFRLYRYAAFLLRYGQSFAVATGSGFAKPSTGYGDYFR